MPLRGYGVRSDFDFPLATLVVFSDYSFEITRTGSPALYRVGGSAPSAATQRSSGFISTVTSRGVTGCPCLGTSRLWFSSAKPGHSRMRRSSFLTSQHDGTGFGDPGLKADLGP